MTPTTAEEIPVNNTVEILDQAGLEALPKGATILDSEGDYFQRTDSEPAEPWRMYFPLDRTHGGCTYSHSEIATCAPVTLLNPEILLPACATVTGEAERLRERVAELEARCVLMENELRVAWGEVDDLRAARDVPPGEDEVAA